MLNTKSRICKIAAICILFILSGFMFYGLLSTAETSPLESKEDILSFLAKKYNYNPQSIEIKAQEKKLNLLAVYYSVGGQDKLLIMEQSKFFKNRYKFFGSAENDNCYFNAYTTNDKNFTLLIVYGDNTKTNADYYTVDAYTVDIDNLYTDMIIKENIKNKDNVLTVYMFLPNVKITSNVNLFNKNGEKISKTY